LKSPQLEQTRNLLFESTRISFLFIVTIIFFGGLSDWAYINAQEYPISLATAFVEYLTSYVSAFIITGIEIAAIYYFVRKYDLGKTKRLFTYSIIAGALGFIAYIVGETLAFLGSLGNTNAPLSQIIALEISPVDLDYGNALVIFLSIFSLVMLVGVLFRINPPRIQKGNLQNRTGFVGGVWTSIITTFAAVVCCGPLPAAILAVSQIPAIYFTDVIDFQSLIVLVSVPFLVYAIILADRRARRGCKLR
jgi:hypothetical protein